MCQKRSTTKCIMTVRRGNGFDFLVCRVDACLVNRLEFLNQHGIKTLGSCCGHGRYPMTIVIEDDERGMVEIVSNTDIPRKKRFYKKDSKGHYFIPEVSEERK